MDKDKTKAQLLAELTALRQRVAELETTKAEHKEEERALRAGQEELEAIFNSIGDGVALIDLTGKVLRVNKRIVEVGGYAEEEIVGKRLGLFKMFPPRSLVRILSNFTTLISGQRVPPFEVEVYTKAGKKLDVELQGSLWKHGGRTVGMIGVMRDITERKRAEEALQESEEAHRQLFEQSVDGIVIYTSDRIIKANASFCDLHNLPIEKIVGANILDLIHPDDRDTAIQRMEAIRSKGSAAKSQVYRALRADGSTFWIEGQGRRIEWKGMPAFQSIVRDITERKLAEREIRQLNQFQESVIDNANIWLNVLDEKTNVVVWNKAAEAISGYSREEVVEHDKIWEWLYPDEGYCHLVRAEAIAIIDGARGEKEVETIIRRKDGETRIISWNSHSLLNEEGDPMGSIALGRDVTERRQTEKALQASEEAYRLLFEQNVDGIVIVARGCIVTANQAFCTLHGLPLEKVIGANPLDLVHPEDREIGMQRITAVESGQSIPRTYTYRAFRKDGATIWTEVRSKRIEWEGKPAIQSIVRDVTERRQAEETLRQRANQLALLNDVGGKIAAMLKLNHILDRAAHLLQESFGYHHVALFTIDREQGEFVMRAKAGDFAHLFPSDHRLKIRQGMVGWAGYYGKTLLANDVDAEPRYVNLYPGVVPTRSELSVPVGVAGEVVGVLDIQSPQLDAFSENDVMVMETLADQIAVAIENARLYEAIELELMERERMEEQLRRQERLAAVGQLAGGIAHDFNNLLATIILYAQMTLGKRELAPDVTRAIQTILDESKRAAKLVQQILDFSRRSMMTTQPVDLASFIEEVIAVLRRTIPENIHFFLEMKPEEYIVEADPTRIQQALINLALNARDAMPDGGELRVGLARVEVGPEEAPPVAEMSPGDWVCLAVSDTGTGLTEEARSHLFEPFFTTKPVGKGTGLGLAQVYGIVKQHQGHIGVETAKDEGTVFRIYLPAYQEEKGEMEEVNVEESSALPRGEGERILLVEDEQGLQDAMRGILELLGYRVLTAAHGEEALEVHRGAEEQVDLVITDLVMPEVGGRQLIRELRQENPDLKALAITGHVMQSDLEALRDEGFLDVVHKPFDASRLAKVVRRALEAD